MARRPDRERIQAARRAAIVERLVVAGIPRTDLERWLAAWERQAAERHLPATEPDFWPAGESWILGKRAVDRKPPP